MGPKMMKPTMTNVHTSGIFADMTVDGPVIGDLVVVIDRARNLPNRKTMGKQDPYCAARLGKEAKKTDTDRRGGQTPKWDQELRFTVHDSPDYYKLKVSVFNDDRKTDLIGEKWIDLKDVIARGGGQHDGWHGLNCKGRPSGELRMEITYYDTREREERPVEDRMASKTRESESQESSRSGNVRRRPLPQGPLPQRAQVQTPTSASAIFPSGRKGGSDARPARHTSTDATGDGSVDPYEHRHKMMVAHGLPFDPSSPKKDGLRSYNGGPRPAPGQKGFTDLEKLSYRNRGLQLPESPRQVRTQQPQPLPSQPDHFSAHQPDTEAVGELLNVSNVSEPICEPIDSPGEGYQPTNPEPLQHIQYQTPYFDIPENESYENYNAETLNPQDHTPNGPPPEQPIPYIDHDVDSYPEAEYMEHRHYDTSAAVEGEDLPPPPPPPHRSSCGESNSLQNVENTFQDQAGHGSFSQGLAHLNSQDDFYKPSDNSTQLTTYSEPPVPTTSGYHQGYYNHGHHIHQLYEQDQHEYQSSQHRRSMQEMRPYLQADQAMSLASWRSSDDGQRQGRRHDELSTFEEPEMHTPQHNPPTYYPNQPPLYTQYIQNIGDAYEQNRHQQTIQASSQANDPQKAYEREYHDSSLLDEFQEERFHSSPAPLIKPRAVLPNANPQIQGVSSTDCLSNRQLVTRKSVSPSPEPRRASSPRLSGVAFSPDSFDVLNPQVSIRNSASTDGNGMILPNYSAEPDSSPMVGRPRSNSQIPSSQVEDVIDPNAPIRDSSGRLIDPSDHLPSSTWAPEPEPKKPLKQPEIKLRFRGAVPMPSAAPRARRPSVELPQLRSSVQSSHLVDNPSPGVESVEKTGRNKLQKKVRVMMTSGARRNETGNRKPNQRLENGNNQPLRDIPNINGSVGPFGDNLRDLRNREVYGQSYKPQVPAKIPLGASYEENISERNFDGTDALSREISSIDIGPGSGGRIKKTRFATTLM